MPVLAAQSCERCIVLSISRLLYHSYRLVCGPNTAFFYGVGECPQSCLVSGRAFGTLDDGVYVSDTSHRHRTWKIFLHLVGIYGGLLEPRRLTG